MKIYDKIAKNYDIKHNSPSTNHLRKWEKKIIKRYAFGKVLDVGCGTGHHLDFLKSINLESVGIDSSKEMIKNSKHNIIFADANIHMPFKENAFDSVICMNSTLNLLEEKSVLEMNRVLKQNGILVISLSSIWDKQCPRFLEKLKTKKTENHMKAKTVMIEKNRLDIRLFEKEDFAKMMDKHGFRVIDFYGLFIFQRPYWGRFQSFSGIEKAKLWLDNVQLFKDLGTMYICVFQKIEYS